MCAVVSETYNVITRIRLFPPLLGTFGICIVIWATNACANIGNFDVFCHCRVYFGSKRHYLVVVCHYKGG